MNKVLCLLLALITAAYLQAQEYNLNNYKYRFQRYQSAQFNFNFIGNNNYKIDRGAYTYNLPNSATIHNKSDQNTYDIYI